MALLSVSGLTKKFGGFTAVKDVSFEVKQSYFKVLLEQTHYLVAKADLEDATEITLPDWDRRTRAHRAGDALARMLSPVL